MKKNAVFALLMALGTVSTARAQTTISFDPRPAGSRVGIEGYTEGGMVFDDALSPGSVIAAGTAGVPSNGTAFLSKCGLCRPSMQAAEGGLFDLFALDVGEHLIFGSGPFPTTLSLTGTRSDGTTAPRCPRRSGARTPDVSF